MKKIKVTLMVLLMMLFVAIIPAKSYAGLTITSSGTFKNVNVSTAFAYSYNLRVSSSTLGENKLDPHLMLNSDWGAVVYLMVSTYGRGGTTGGSDTSSLSSNNNSSGVYGNSNNGCHVASLIEECQDTGYIKNLMDYSSTKYVEILPKDSNDPKNSGRAFISSWGGSYGYLVTRPVFVRTGFEQTYGTGNYGTGRFGHFRPAIWN